MHNRQTRHRLGHDALHHALQVAKHLDGGNSHRPDFGLVQPGVSRHVASGTIAPLVRLSIHFDREPRVAAEEIEGIGARRMLSAEFKPGGADAKFAP
jgi:hypothetical protein